MKKAEFEENLISHVIASINKHGGKSCLSSIILTGSFGRGEPTYIVDNKYELCLKSDVEVALVYPKFSQKKTVEQLIQTVSSEFEEDLNLMPISEKRIRKAYNFNFSLRVPKYKTIFTYDLFNGSKTIWGRDYIGEKNISLNDVDKYEAKRLVANRIGELIYLQNTADINNRDYLRQQWKGKLVLAIISAWLICEGEYVSSYHGQFEKVREDANKIERLLGQDFFKVYKKIFCFLRENGEQYEIPDKLLRSYVRNMDLYFNEKEIKSPKVNSLSRIMKYTLKYMRSGIKYGFRQFEANILQALITDYWNKSECIEGDAEVWHRVLY